MEARKVFIFGYYGWKNVGDDAMLYAILKELSNYDEIFRFYILSNDKDILFPEKLADKINFVKPSIPSVFINLFKSSIILIGGGTHISDYGTKIHSVKRLMRILFLAFFAKIFSKKFYIIGNGIGPMSTKCGERLARLICCMADCISVRDKESYIFLEKWHFDNKTILAFDPAVLIRMSTNPKLQKKCDKFILGVSVTPVFTNYYKDYYKDVLIIEKIAKELNMCLRENKKIEIHLFIFHGKSKDDDVFITEMLYKKLNPIERVKIISYDRCPKNILLEFEICNAFIGMKYHSLVFAYMNNLPLLVIDYHPKCRSFADMIGLPNYAVVSPIEILNDEFPNYVRNFVKNPEKFKAKLPLTEALSLAKKGFNCFKINQ